MKRVILFLTGMVCLVFTSRSQYLTATDFMMIGNIARDEEYYFEHLYRYETGVIDLNPFEYAVVYYGFVLQGNLYRDDVPYSFINAEKAVNKGKYKSAYSAARKVLKNYPLHLPSMRLCLLSAPERSDQTLLTKNYFGTLDAIEKSNSGDSRDSAKMVIFEWDILEYFDHFFPDTKVGLREIIGTFRHYEVETENGSQSIWFDTHLVGKKFLTITFL